LIDPAVVPEPAGGMTPGRIMVCPVDESSLFIPDIFTGKANGIAFL
jgi:hypothetical protein